MIKSKNKITIYNIASTLILQGLAFFSGPIFSGMLGSNGYGIASVYLTWVQIASTVFTLQAAGTVALARSNFPLEDQSKYQSSVLSLATLFYTGFSILTIITASILSIWFNINLLLVILGLAQGWGMYTVSFMNSKFTYEFKADKNFILSVVTSVSTIALSIFLIYQFSKEKNYYGRIIGQSFVYTTIGLIMFYYIIKNGKELYNKEYWKFTLPIAIPTVFHLLASILLNQSDKIMLQRLIDNSATGVYALACTFGAVLSTIWTALNNSWVPFYYEYTRLNQIEDMRKHAKNYIELFTIIAIGFVFLCREVFHLYAPYDFWEGTKLLPVFSLGYYFVFLYSFPVNYEFYNKKTKTIAAATIIAAFFNIVFNYIFICTFGIIGAVIATALAHSIQFVIHYVFAKRIDPDNFPFKMTDFIPGLVVICFACIIYYLTESYWLIRWGICSLLALFIVIKIYKRKEIF